MKEKLTHKVQPMKTRLNDATALFPNIVGFISVRVRTPLNLQHVVILRDIKSVGVHISNSLHLYHFYSSLKDINISGPCVLLPALALFRTWRYYSTLWP